MFFDNFSRLCKERGTSPTAVGQMVGVQKNTVSYWKKNGTLPKQEQLEEMAKILNCSVADFFSEPSGFHGAVANVRNRVENGTIGDVITNVGTTSIADPMGEMSDDERELLSLYRKLSAIDRAKLMVTADEMANGARKD